MSEKSLICTQKFRSPKPLPFGAKMITSMQKYNMELDNNVRLLSIKYPNEPSIKLKQLLQELENNVHMAEDVLLEQGSKPIVESKTKQVRTERVPCNDPQKKMLMRGLLSLFKKLEKANDQVVSQKEEILKLKKELQFHKTRSSLLAQEQLTNEFDKNMHIF